MKKIFDFPLFLLFYSCSPASSGRIWQDAKGCSILTNESSSTKITFVLQFPLISNNKDSVGYVYKEQIALAPQEDHIIGCDSAASTYQIIGAYENH